METAANCFNQSGYGNVSLQDIAREMGISRGNLAYHFQQKEDLLKAISAEMWTKIQADRERRRSFPSFENLHKDARLYARYQQEYAFIFTDPMVLTAPGIADQFREMTELTLDDNRAAIAFSIKTGNMRPEPYPGLYNHLAHSTWMLMFYWLPQQTIRGITEREDAEKAIWSLILPHLTAKGIRAFEGFFGTEYLQQLGEAFDYQIDEINVF